MAKRTPRRSDPLPTISSTIVPPPPTPIAATPQDTRLIRWLWQPGPSSIGGR